MEILIKAQNANAYFEAMADLGKKFDNKYIDGKIEDIVRFNVINDRLELAFTKEVSEMVRVACTMAFVSTML